MENDISGLIIFDYLAHRLMYMILNYTHKSMCDFLNVGLIHPGVSF